MADKSIVDGIKFKEMREAVVALNESGLIETKIKLVGVDKEAILKSFMKAVQEIPDKDGKFPGPKVSLDFYNMVVELEERAAKAESKEEKKDKEKTGKGDTGEKKDKEKTGKGEKKDKEKTGKGEKKDKGEKKESKPGVIAMIIEVIKKKGPIDITGIKKELVKAFPDREEKSMAGTIQAQIGGKKRPLRIEKEKGIKFKIDDDGKFTFVEK